MAPHNATQNFQFLDALKQHGINELRGSDIYDYRVTSALQVQRSSQPALGNIGPTTLPSRLRVRRTGASHRMVPYRDVKTIMKSAYSSLVILSVLTTAGSAQKI